MKISGLMLSLFLVVFLSSCSKDSNSTFGQVTYYDKVSKTTQPAGNAYIQFLSSGKGAHYYDTDADVTGYYDLKNIYSGHYSITATYSPDGGTTTYSGTATVDLSYNDDKVADIKVQ